MKEEMQWEDPPEIARMTKWITIQGKLKEEPGRWAKVAERNSGSAHALASQLRKKFGDEYETVSRKRPDGKVGVWSRYVGGD